MFCFPSFTYCIAIVSVWHVKSVCQTNKAGNFNKSMSIALSLFLLEVTA